MNFEAKDPRFEEKLRRSFNEQNVMRLIGASLGDIAPGKVDIKLPYRTDLAQQDDFVHAGIITTISDSACGFAAFSLMPAGTRVLSVEFKQNLLAPAIGEFFVAEGRVIRPGKTLSVVRGDVFSVFPDGKKLIATMLATMICIEDTV